MNNRQWHFLSYPLDTETPLVSVVMPSFNQCAYLEETIRSVLDQDYSHLELIVADGGSTDQSVDILKRLQSEDKRVRWLSHQDNGPAQAINNALAQARGTIIGWLNSDDLYMAGAVSSAVQALDDCPDWLMVYGQGQHISATGQKLDIYPTLPPPQPLSSFMHGCFICQPTVFFRRSMYVLLGGLDETFETAFDFDYWLKAFSAFTNRIGFVDRLQASSRFHDACITLRQRRTVALEGVQLLARHVGTAPIEWLLTYRNELLNGKAQLPEGMSLKQELTALLKDAEAYFDERDLQRLAEQFDVKEL